MTIPLPPRLGRRAAASALIEESLREARAEERDLINKLRRVRAEITDLQAGLIGLGVDTKEEDEN